MTEPKEKNRMRKLLAFAVCATLALGAAACGSDDDDSGGGGGGGGDLSGTIRIDGSSTVGPFAQAAQEAFVGENPGVRITVAQSGTGGGFEKFCAGETDISNASRPIDEEEEVPLCDKEGVKYTEVQVANDGISIATNPELQVKCLTTDQLKAIWEPGSRIENWQDVPGGDYPDEALELAGPGTDSGTFDYFTDEINGEEGASRSDYAASEDDNVIVRTVEGAPGGIGYFGFSYFEENQDSLKALEIDGGAGCVAPSADTAQSGEYAPLARPLFIYVNNEALARPEVEAFVRYYIESSQAIAEDALFVPLTDEQKDEALSALGKAAAR
jgi:phosphate transport system substrate-binding protein